MSQRRGNPYTNDDDEEPIYTLPDSDSSPGEGKGRLGEGKGGLGVDKLCAIDFLH